MSLYASVTYSGLKVLQHHAGSPAFGCEKKKKIVLHLKKLIIFEFTGSPSNSMRGTPISLSTKLTSQSDVVALINTRPEMVSRAAALMNGEEES